MEIVSFVIGGVGIIFGLRCYMELRRWARDCQNARIAIAYKRKVVMSPPLVEWLLWCRNVKKDKSATGQVVFSRAGVSVAVAQAVYPPSKIRLAIRRARARKNAPPAPVQEGSWSAQDQTVKT